MVCTLDSGSRGLGSSSGQVIVKTLYLKSRVRLLEALKDEKMTPGKVSNFIVAFQRKNKIFLTQFQIHTNSYSTFNFNSIQLF